jgi:hypothetical protein
MKNIFKASIGLLLLTTSCSSIINGTKQTVTIDSNVKGADININGTSVGTTPFTGKIPRGSSTQIYVSKEGYESKSIILNSDIEPIFWGNILTGGVLFVGSSTDFGTGALYKYNPATVVIDLQKKGK